MIYSVECCANIEKSEQSELRTVDGPINVPCLEARDIFYRDYKFKMHCLEVGCKISSPSGADPDLQLRGRPNYVMWFGGKGPNGVQGQSPGSWVRGTSSP